VFEGLLVATAELEEVDGRALAACMDKLEPRARKVVTLGFREDRSAEEIAAALGTSAGNVRVIRHRALAALRQCLDEAGLKSTAVS
jgi:RNA polymerase sigma-70 factor (ECF subfamily)